MTIHIAAAFDQNYYNQFCSFITSILENKEDEKIIFHIISPDLPEKFIKRIENYVYLFKDDVVFHNPDTSSVKSYKLRSTYSEAVYYRLLFPELLKNHCEKFLYIDTDTIVVKSLVELYSISTECYPIAAVYDNYVKKREVLGINELGNYFNSGVMLVNIAIWLEQKISEKASDYLLKYPDRIHYVDQCALNGVLLNNWKKLPPTCNLMYSYLPWDLPIYRRKKYLDNTFIVHYTLQRPWEKRCRNPLRYLYRRYWNLSPIKQKKPFYVKDKGNSNREWLWVRVYEVYLNFKCLIFKEVESEFSTTVIWQRKRVSAGNFSDLELLRSRQIHS